MTEKTQAQTYGFQTEVNQLLKIVVNSLYSNKEIFLRELISNASDAIEKLRFDALEKPELIKDNAEFFIKVDFDKEKQTITVSDNGTGMLEQEVIDNLGTIAKSGTQAFLDSLTGDQSKDSQLIGQFGVGFYSSFIVADKVTVKTLKAGQNADQAIQWESDGQGEFTIKNITKAERGTEVILRVKDDETEFLDDSKLRNLIKKYSDHISVPVQMKKRETDEEGNETVSEEYETVNKAKALWLRPKSEISDEEYKEFYKHISHDFNEPFKWAHNKVEGNLEYTTLLYIPSKAPFDLWDRDRKTGLQLYVQRVFIMECTEVLPSYLRFVKGVIDSNDLPLNVSREMLQHNRVIEKIKKACVKKVLDMLSKMAKNEPEQYEKFWQEFGQVIKEGPAEDFENREKIAKLLRFATTHNDTATQDVSLDEYIARMKEGQKYIYYVTADSFSAAKNNPQLEIFRKKDIEVLLLYDRVDEWMTSHLDEYDGKTIKSIGKGELDLGDLEDKEDKKEEKENEEEFKKVIDQMKETLKDKVEDVKVSKRLTDSPSCVVVNDYGMSIHLQKLMAEAGQPSFGAGKPTLEINPDHRLIQGLKDEQDDERFNELSNLLYQQAVLAEGGNVEDPASFVKLVNKYLTPA